MRTCPRCKVTSTPDAFCANASRRDGLDTYCRACKAARRRDAREDAPKPPGEGADDAAAAARIMSDYDSLRPEDFDVTIGNVGKRDPNASREKRQEYSRAMGENARALERAAAAAATDGTGDVLAHMDADAGTYIGKLAEQERRFNNRRIARSVSLAQAAEALAIAQFKRAAQQYLGDRVVPVGYAAKGRQAITRKRSVCLLLSDLHLGADLSALDEPIPFRAVEEARRLEHVIRECADYKPQHRAHTELVLLLNGDMIEGQLGHDLRGGAPLTEQKVIFWRYFRAVIGFLASAFPSVRVICQSGNHGRDKVRHPGRATARKWDGHEWELYYALSCMCSSLKNVTFTCDFRAVSLVDLHGLTLALTHGDTEFKLGHPDKAASANRAALDRVNHAGTWRARVSALAIGHYHTPRYHPGDPSIIYNGALVPPNGHARTEGYTGERCGQFMWEAVEGFPVGDVRFIEVGTRQDNDDKLGTIIQPFRFE